MLARGRGRGSSCCESTLALVVDVVIFHSRRDKTLECLTNLVRSIKPSKVVRILQVCHDNSMPGSIEKGRVEGHGEEAEWVPLRDNASGGLGSRPDTSNSELATEALAETSVIHQEMIVFLIRDGFTLQCVESVEVQYRRTWLESNTSMTQILCKASSPLPLMASTTQNR